MNPKDLMRFLKAAAMTPKSAVTAQSKMGALSRPDVASVGRLTRQGAFWSFVMHLSKQSIALAGTVILARLLSPSDYGLVAMVATFTALLQSLSDFGLAWATIQRNDLTEGQVHDLFWLNTGLGVFFAIVSALAAPGVAAFYGQPELQNITLAIGLSFALVGVAAQPTALMKRQMNFRTFSAIVIASTLVGVSVGIIAAIAGAGYWALVLQILSTQMFRTVFVFVGSGYRPHLPARDPSTLSLVKFGGYIAITGVMLFFAQSFDNVVVGRLQGATELGYYSRAYFIASLPAFFATATLTSVIVPSLSALRHEGERMASAYRRALSTSALLGFPTSLGLAVVAAPAVRLVYGEAWHPVVPLLVWLSIGGLFQPVYQTASWLFISSGKGRAYFLWSGAASTLLVIGFLIGARWGALGVAVASSIVWTFIITLPSLFAAHRAAGISLAPSLRILRFPLAASLAMAGVVRLIGSGLEALEFPWYGVVLVQIPAGVVVYCLLTARLVRPLPFDLPRPLRTLLRMEP